MSAEEHEVVVARRRDVRALVLHHADLADAVDRVLALCDEWDALSRGESPTTAAIRRAIGGE